MLGIYLLPERERDTSHNIETSLRIFGKWSTDGEKQVRSVALFRSIAYVVSFIMHHLIKPTHCASRESCTPQPHGILPKVVGNVAVAEKRELIIIGHYRKFSFDVIRARQISRNWSIMRVHVVIAASANEHSDIFPPSGLKSRGRYALRSMRIAMHARGSFVISRAHVVYWTFITKPFKHDAIAHIIINTFRDSLKKIFFLYTCVFN